MRYGKTGSRLAQRDLEDPLVLWPRSRLPVRSPQLDQRYLEVLGDLLVPLVRLDQLSQRGQRDPLSQLNRMTLLRQYLQYLQYLPLVLPDLQLHRWLRISGPLWYPVEGET